MTYMTTNINPTDYPLTVTVGDETRGAIHYRQARLIADELAYNAMPGTRVAIRRTDEPGAVIYGKVTRFGWAGI